MEPKTICSKQIPLTGYTPDTPDQGRLQYALTITLLLTGTITHKSKHTTHEQDLLSLNGSLCLSKLHVT